MRAIWKKSLVALGAIGLSGLAGCTVYGPGPVVYARPGIVVAPAPIVVGGYYPRPYGYYGYYGWHRGGHCWR